MVICKFFLQGTCRFGENCKFEHQLNNDHNYGTSGSVLYHKQQSSNSPDLNTLIRSIINDMVAAEKGGQWLLSSYTPFKEKSPFPGFEDQSYEEIRLNFYEAMKLGNIEQFKQSFQLALQQAAVRMKALNNPSGEALELIKKLYGNNKNSSNSQGQGLFQSNNNAFGNSSTSGLFGQSGFGQQQQQNSAASSIFAKTNQTLFGGNQQNNNNTSIFGTSNSSNTGGGIFSGNQSTFGQNTSMFANQAPQIPSMFGGGQSNVFQAQQQPNSNPFTNKTQTNMPFGLNQQNPVSVFNSQLPNSLGQPQLGLIYPQQPQQQTPQQQALQQSQQQQQALQQPLSLQQPPQQQQVLQQHLQQSLSLQQQPQQQPQALQQQSQQQLPLQQQTQQQMLLQQQLQLQQKQPQQQTFSFQQAYNNSTSSSSNSILSNSANTVINSNIFQIKKTQQPPIDEDFYSPPGSLTDKELAAFEGDLDIFNLPEKPPTYEMCFK